MTGSDPEETPDRPLDRLAARARVSLEAWLSLTAAPTWVAAFRISYALVVLPIAVQNLGYLEFRWHGYPSGIVGQMTALNVVWVLALLTLLCGRGGRLPAIVNFLSAPLLLSGTVGTDLIKAAGLWLIALDTPKTWRLRLPWDPEPETPAPAPRAWPLHLLALQVGFLISTAGVSKAFDPVWRAGWGFYYTLLQPWIKPSLFNLALDSRALMLAGNYATIASETLTLPLLLFRRTRAIGILLMLGMFAQLTFVFRIDPIGPVGLTICVGLAAMDERFRRLLRWALRRPAPPPDAAPAPPPVSLRGLSSLVALGAACFLTWQIVQTTRRHLPAVLDPPRVDRPFARADRLRQRGPLEGDQTPLRVGYRHHARWTHLVGWYAPFNLRHLFARHYYAVDVVLDDGSVLSPVPVFNDDGTTNAFGPSGWALRPRTLQNRCWALGLLSLKLAQRFDEAVISASDRALLEALVELNLAALPAEARPRARTVRIRVRPIVVPNRYAGDARPWLEAPWTVIYQHDVASNRGGLAERPAPVDLSKLEFEVFRSGRVVLDPAGLR